MSGGTLSARFSSAGLVSAGAGESAEEDQVGVRETVGPVGEGPDPVCGATSGASNDPRSAGEAVWPGLDGADPP